jgi:glucose dehydrogenase
MMRPALLALLILLRSAAPQVSAQNRTSNVDWPLHNLDLAGSRFSTMDQISRGNVKTLTPRWLFQHGVIDGVSNQTTPVIVNVDVRHRLPRQRLCLGCGRRPSTVDI